MTEERTEVRITPKTGALEVTGGPVTVHNWAPTPEQARQISEAFDRQGVNPECPRCRSNAWSIELAALLLAPLPFPAGSPFPSTGHLPIALVTCDHCGFVATHALKVLGIEI
jgi:hypothetical protein